MGTRTMIFACLMTCILSLPSFGQFKKDLEKAHLTSLNKVEIFSDGKKFPISHLYHLNEQRMTVAKVDRVPFHRDFIAYQSFSLDDIDKVRVYDKRERKKAWLICGLGLGAASYFLANELVDKSKTKGANVGLEALGQSPKSGFFEPIVAGTMGLALGIAFAEWIYPIDLDFKRKKRESMRRLKYELGANVSLRK